MQEQEEARGRNYYHLKICDMLSSNRNCEMLSGIACVLEGKNYQLLTMEILTSRNNILPYANHAESY